MNPDSAVPSTDGPRPVPAELAAAGSLHAAVLDALVDEVAIVDATGTILWVNRSWRRFAAENAGGEVEPVGMNYLDVCDQASRYPAAAEGAVEAAEGVRGVLAGRQARFELEYPCHAPTEQRWFRLTATRLEAASPAVVVSHRNITEARKAADAVRLSEQNLSITLGSIGDAVIATDAQGRITRMNRTAEQLTGWPASDAVGKPLLEIFRIVSTHTGDPAPDPVRRVLADGGVANLAGDTTLVARDGGRIQVADSAAPIRDDSGAIVGVVLVFSDVTDRYQADRALLRAKELLDKTGELARIGGWEVDLTTMKLSWTRETFRIAEIEPPIEPPLEGGINLFAPEARPVITAAVQAAADTGTPYDLELPLITAKGRRRWVQTQGFAEFQGGQPVRLFGTFQDITERRQAEAALAESQLRFRAIIEASSIPMALNDEQGRITFLNPAFIRTFGYDERDIPTLEDWWPKAYPDPAYREWVVANWLERVERSKRTGEPFEALEATVRCKDGGDEVVVGNAVPLSEGFAGTHLVQLQSITARKQAERERAALEGRLAQSQKMEAVGRLAGGVAHDFNNMLGIILGRAELALEQVDPDTSLYDDIEQIRAAAERSAALTGQLLAFARRQPVRPRALDLDTAIAGTLSLLRRLIGEDIAIDWRPGGVGSIWMDQSQLDQVMANLCVNARDAIAGAGTITIATTNRTFDREGAAGQPDVAPGEYVGIAVSDTGKGIPEAALPSIFEPFFTTKEVGHGTGLGLAMVDGAVRQNGGFITVASEPGHGTTFEIFLPAYGGPATEPPAPRQPGPRAAGATVLLVEDEPGVLEVASRTLTEAGYKVLAAQGPEEALQLARAAGQAVDLLLTDVIMPAMNGQDLATALRKLTPGLKVLYMSGYTADVIARRGVLHFGTNFLQKPFGRADLEAAVGDALA